MKKFLFFFLLFVAGQGFGQTDTLVKWTFPNNPDDSVADGGISVNLSRYIDGVGCGTTGYANQGFTTNCARATGWDGGADTKFWQILISTIDHDSLIFTSKQRSSSTGPKHFKIRYKTSSAGTWTDLPGATVSDTTTWIQMFTDTLPTACNNVDSLYISWIMTDNNAVNGSTVASTGSSSIDDIKIWGRSISGIIPPVVNAAYIIDLSNIAVIFNEAVNSTAQITSNYTFSGGSVNNITLSATSDTAFLVLTTPIINGNSYSLTVQDVEDITSTPMAAPQTFNFLFNNSIQPIVITEIMYNPPESGNDSLEFVELYNNSASTALVGGYSFKVGAPSGVTYYDFPAGATIAANSYVVIARNPTIVDNFFGITGTLQWATGQSMSNNGTKLHLVNTLGEYIDSLSYQNSAPWPTGGAGNGASISMCDPSLDNSVGSNWLASAEFVDSLNLKAVTANPGTGCITTGIFNEVADNNTVTCYPNPADDFIMISTGTNESDIVIFDVLGNKIFSMKSTSPIVRINTAEYSRGIYFICVHTDGKMFSKKISVE
jgi:hypothetical protein